MNIAKRSKSRKLAAVSLALPAVLALNSTGDINAVDQECDEFNGYFANAFLIPSNGYFVSAKFDAEGPAEALEWEARAELNGSLVQSGNTGMGTRTFVYTYLTGSTTNADFAFAEVRKVGQVGFDDMARAEAFEM